ncbi:hypothetical protein GCM10025883_25160 [Mobilicoccus caccae]|uniref:Hydroxylysine kinase n=1 Tax=Mobilicoccus caccae TaxID=1859295 RepID=A0ABQ6ITT2_9MICO|nr:hypothetical protein GCM10025883_25160 [Mobilicoccus caccae]
MVDRVDGDLMSEEAPRLSEVRRIELLRGSWGLAADVLKALPSERDLNVMVDDAYVLKVTNPAEPDAIVEMEVAAMAHVAEADPDLPVPRTVPDRAGELLHEITDDTGRRCLVRLITIVPGEMSEGLPIDEDLAEQVGRVTARMSQALAGFFHPAAGDAASTGIRARWVPSPSGAGPPGT